MKIAFLPIDNRPVCYSLAKDIAAVDKSIEIVLPDRDLLGDLTKTAQTDKLIEWLKKVLTLIGYLKNKFMVVDCQRMI